MEHQNVIFKPNAGPQTFFLAAGEREVLYGGAAGGGKSYAMLADPLRYLGHPQFSGLLLRHTTEELRELIWKSQEMYPKIYPGIRWSERKMQWQAPSGARLWMSYLDRDEDVLRYQGLAFCVAKDTPVKMADGAYKPIQDIKIGDVVATLEGKSEVTYRSHPLHKPLVKISVYDCFGQLLTEQIQPDTHPIALLSSEPLTQFDDLSHSALLFQKSPIQWLSYKHLEYARQENRGSSSCSAGDQSGYIGFEGDNQESLRPQRLFYPVVLDAQSLHQAQARVSRQYCTSCKSSQSLLGTGQLISGSALGLSLPHESSQLQQGHKLPYSHPSSYGGVDAQLEMQTSVGLKDRCLTCSCQCGGQLLCEKESYRDGAHIQDDAEQHGLAYLHSGGMGCIHERSRYQLAEYSHPYTKEQRHLRVPVELGFVQFETISSPDIEVFDLTIKEHNHYITFGGIVNKNCWIGFDELTQWHTPFAWNYMRSRLRTPASDLPVYMRATTNPGGPGHSWVKKMFIDPSPPGKAFHATDIDTGQPLLYPRGHSKEGQPLFKRRFIPAMLSDNPYLADGGDYETMLLSLPEHQRKQLLEGNWDVAEGAAFPEFNRSIHVIDPFDIPKSWAKFRAADYGYGSYSAVVWFAVSPSDQLIIYRELYVSKVLAKDLAHMVLKAEENDGVIRYGVLDSSCWAKRGDTGPSLAEQMILEGCRWRPADRSAGSRVSGKQQLHRRLQVDPFTEEPRMVITSNCVHTIAQLPVIPLDKKNPEDIDTRSEDHLYDAIRYGIMSRPRSSLWDYNPTTSKAPGMPIADPMMGY